MIVNRRLTPSKLRLLLAACIFAVFIALPLPIVYVEEATGANAYHQGDLVIGEGARINRTRQSSPN
ncbi:MAG: hypothetical protein ACTSUS_07640 [Candidatus Freyarchaeota archaeon]